ncbi:uncharacterized protein LOC113137336 [Mastacembelus armatus]|uniref:uncharacterized protein LOC113137336 n=1 Tax=Mastacembelus armatus TaxID=205130 RepID=UPI000E45869F|nr:uncharacterized protein LOC113137336 [Mastacembelus armatus]
MAGTLHIVMWLLLLLISFIRPGVNGKNGLIAKRGYDIMFPCDEELVCFYIWKIRKHRTSEYIAIVSNGEIQTAKSGDKNCILQIKDVKQEDVGHHRCQQKSNVFSPHYTPAAAPELNFIPGKTASLQCVLLTYMEQGHCYTQLKQQVGLMWVDESGAEVEEDFQHQIKQHSSCDVTLTVTLPSPENKTFRCLATVNDQLHTSVEMRVRAQASIWKGRGFITETEHQGDQQYMIGASIGVGSCVVLTAVIAMFLWNRRKTNGQQLDEPSSPQSLTNDVMDTDVIYADIILPVGSDRVWVTECDSTEYACIQYV